MRISQSWARRWRFLQRARWDGLQKGTRGRGDKGRFRASIIEGHAAGSG